MGHEDAKQIINGYIWALEEIGLSMGYSFEQISHSRWAAKELLKRMDEFPRKPPLLILSDFYDEMERCSKLNSYTRDVFLIACDVTSDIIDRLVEN